MGFGSVAALYGFYIFTIIIAFIVIFLTAGTIKFRAFIIRCTEYSLYLFLMAFVLIGGLSLGSWGLLLGIGGAIGGMIVGSIAGFALAIPIISLILLQIDIAKSSREIASKDLEARR